MNYGPFRTDGTISTRFDGGTAWRCRTDGGEGTVWMLVGRLASTAPIIPATVPVGDEARHALRLLFTIRFGEGFLERFFAGAEGAALGAAAKVETLTDQVAREHALDRSPRLHDQLAHWVARELKSLRALVGS